MKKYYLLLLFILLFTACSYKQASLARSASIIFKTPSMKFYDKGFVNKYDNYINLQIYNFGKVALNIDIYKDQICKSTLECMDSKGFNEQYLGTSYHESFLYDLFNKKNVYFKDKKNNILIKVKYDKMSS